MPLPLGLLLGLGLGVEGLRTVSAQQREAQAVQDRQLAIQNFLQQVNPENQALVGSALNLAQNPDQIINNLVQRRTAVPDPVDPYEGAFRESILNPETGALERILFNQAGEQIGNLGNVPLPRALVEVNTGNRDLPASQAVELGAAAESVANAQNLQAQYKPEFSNMGIDMLGGLGASAEQFLDRVSGDNTERTAFWNNIEADKAKFVKLAFGGNASDRDRQMIDSIYPNPRFDDATNQALLQNLTNDKQRILRSMSQGLGQAGFNTGMQTQQSNDVDFDLTR